MHEEKIPVISCEGACIRRDIARVAANMVCLSKGLWNKEVIEYCQVQSAKNCCQEE